MPSCEPTGPVRSSEAFRARHYTENEEVVKVVIFGHVRGFERGLGRGSESDCAQPGTSILKKTVADFHHLYKNHRNAHQHQPERERLPHEELEKVNARKTKLSGQNEDGERENMFHPDIFQEVAHSWQE
jgi:hypothetical protein